VRALGHGSGLAVSMIDKMQTRLPCNPTMDGKLQAALVVTAIVEPRAGVSWRLHGGSVSTCYRISQTLVHLEQHGCNHVDSRHEHWSSR
jgi:hypothetical protein